MSSRPVARGRAALRPRPALRALPLLLGVPAVLAGLAACGGGDSTGPATPVYVLALRSGVSLAGPATGTLRAVPLLAVTDEDGRPGAGVAGRVSPGGGVTAQDTVVVTGLDGIATVTLLLGAQPGTGSVAARLPSRAGSRVEAPVTIGPRPTIVTVAPASFAPGDTITVTGGEWPASLSPTVVVGGVRARTLGRTDAQVRALAPFCPRAEANGATSVEVTLGDVATTAPVAATLTRVGEALALDPYESATVAAPDVERCLALGGPEAEYLVVPQLADPGPAGSGGTRTPRSFVVALGTSDRMAPVASLSELLRPVVPSADGHTAQRDFDRRLREREAALAPLASAQGAAPLAAGAPPPLASVAPSSRQFWMFASLDDTDDFVRVTATLRHGGERVLLYVDDAAPGGGLTAAEYAELGRLFDTKLEPIVTRNFGAPSDVDRNGRVVVLLSPRVNSLVPAPGCLTTGSVVGYFWGGDLLTSVANSNKGEVFYGLVPDPQGTTGGCPKSRTFVRDFVPVTFVHEYQHMISYNQHVLARGGSQEVTWLNEGLSHISEELTSREYELDPTQPRSTPGQLFPDSSQEYIVSNLQNAADFLGNPSASSLTTFRDFGTLPERGAAWLFLRWLGDQKGEGVYRRLVETRATGAANVSAQAGEPFARLFADFALALYTDLAPDVDRARLDDRYRFTTRDFRQLFARLQEVGLVDRAFPIAPRQLFYGSTATQSLVQGGMDWYLLRGASTSSAMALRFTQSDGSPLPAANGPQVGILRLR